MKLLLSVILLFTGFISYSQENDSSLLRQFNVKSQKKLLYIHAFENKKDSCLYNERHYNSLGMVTYERTNLMCLGYNTYEEVKINYEEGKVASLEVKRDGVDFNKTTNEYGTKVETPEYSNIFFYQTNDSITTRSEYFTTKKGKLDSSYTTQVMQDGSVKNTVSIARYDKKGNLVQLVTIDKDRNLPTEQASYEVDKEGVILSAGFQTYGEKAEFIQYYYTYYPNGKMESSVNSFNQRQEFFYHENGLLKNILSYNTKAELESEYIFEYSYNEE